MDEFVSRCRKRVTIECLREDLDSYFRTLKSAMVELINKDYADFVNLSSNLVRGGARGGGWGEGGGGVIVPRTTKQVIWDYSYLKFVLPLMRSVAHNDVIMCSWDPGSSRSCGRNNGSVLRPLVFHVVWS